MTTAVMTSKGQVVIPVAIRKHLNMKAGVRFSVFEQGTGVVFQPLTRAYFDSMAGMLGTGMGLVDALLKERAKERKREDRKIKRYMEPKR